MTARKRKQWLWSTGNGLIMLVLSLWWMSTSRATGDEKKIVQWSSAIRSIVFQKEPNPDEFIFIDVSHDKALIPSESGNGSDVITDRAMLAKFFENIDKKKRTYKFILCDVSLQGKTSADAALKKGLQGLDKIVIATDLNEMGEPEMTNFAGFKGITTYQQSSDTYLKFRLFQDKATPTLPVSMYTQLTRHHFDEIGPFYTDNGKLCFNNIIADQRIREFSVFQEHRYPLMRLNDAVQENTVTLNDTTLNNRIVIIGDFESDRHDTVLGETPGALLLLNVYLSLMKGEHLLDWFWLGLIAAALIVLSKIILFHKTRHTQRSLSFLGPLLQSGVFLFFLSLVSYLFFHRQLQIFILTSYMTSLDFAINFIRKPEKKAYLKSQFLKLKKELLW